LNAFDSGDSRATVVAIGIVDDETTAEEKMPTLNTPSASGGGHPPAVYSTAVRRLTPRECEALQGFPLDWTAIGSDSARYKQMGNAVTVPVAEYMGFLISSALADEPVD
jgi:site-specific DNA-cytosine methylase